MEIVHIPKKNLPIFGSLEFGDLFRHEEYGGLFVKIPYGNGADGLIVEPIDVNAPMDKGQVGNWTNSCRVIPVTKITVES